MKSCSPRVAGEDKAAFATLYTGCRATAKRETRVAATGAIAAANG